MNAPFHRRAMERDKERMEREKERMERETFGVDT